MQLQKHTTWFAFAAATGVGAATAQAAIVQVQAEDGTAGSNWSVVAEGSASGGEFLEANSGTAFDGMTNTASMVTYSLNFAEAGDYDLYIRVRINSSGTSDSFFISTAFNTAAPDDDQRELYEGGPNFDPVPVLEGGVFGEYVAGDYVWINFTDSVQEHLDPGSPFLSGNSEVGTFNVPTAGTYTYMIGGREANFGFDAIAFANEEVMVAPDGTLVPIPEPASLALIGLGGACALARRRRA